MSRVAALKQALSLGSAEAAYQRMPDVYPLQDLSRSQSLQCLPAYRPEQQDGQDADADESRIHWLIAQHSWLYQPSTPRQKLACLSFWAVVSAGLVALFVWLFPKLVDGVIEPATQVLKDRLTHVQIALVAIAAMMLLPLVLITHTPFIWLAALTLGFWRALLVVEIGTLLGASLAFALGKSLLHGPALRVMQRYQKVRAVLLAVHQAGAFKVVLLFRLGPVPYSASNYLLSIPKAITFGPYTLASLLALLPHNILEVFLGHNVHGISALLKGEPVHVGQVVMNLLGLVASLVVVCAGWVYARRALQEIRQQELMAQEEAAAAAGTAVATGAALGISLDATETMPCTAVPLPGQLQRVEPAGLITPMMSLRTASMDVQ